jgi:hypothetical protein
MNGSGWVGLGLDRIRLKQEERERKTKEERGRKLKVGRVGLAGWGAGSGGRVRVGFQVYASV